MNLHFLNVFLVYVLQKLCFYSSKFDINSRYENGGLFAYCIKTRTQIKCLIRQPNENVVIALETNSDYLFVIKGNGEL